MELVKMIHPDTGNVVEVPASALPFMYASGWRILADDETTEPAPAAVPAPVTRAQLAKARTAKLPPPGEASSEPPSESAESEGK